jgi:transposase InsO family protein
VHANQALIARRRVLHQQTWEAYGARKRWHLLTHADRVGGRQQVAWRRRRSVRTVQMRQQETPAIPNRRNQPFAVSAKNRGWTGDLTFVPTRTGWLTRAAWLDLSSLRIVGGP